MSSSPNRAWLSEFLQKIGNYLVGISLLCYLSGFVITNLYLGSLGIVNLEILKARYVLAGFLFLLFLGAITYLVYGLIQCLRKYQQEAILNIILRVIWYSFENISILFFAILALAVLTGSISSPPIGLPQLSPTAPWSAWFNIVPASVLHRTALLMALVIPFFVLVFSIFFIIINPKDKQGITTPRKQVIVDMFNGMWQNKWKIIGYLFGLSVFTFLLLLINSALSFITYNKVTDLSGNSTPLSSEGWPRFLGAIILIYSFVAVYLTFLFIMPSSSEKSNNDNPSTKTSGLFLFVIMAIVFIVPTYALGVYPSIPQQIGGGQILRVEVNIDNYEVKRDFSSAGVEIYLIDRTSNSSIFLIIDAPNQAHKVIEVTNNLIQSVIYNP